MRMRPIFLAALVVIALSFSIAAPASAGQKLEIIANVSSISGEVEIKKAGETKKQTAKEGMQLGSGDIVITGSGGSCVIAWGHDNVVQLDSFSKLSIEKLETIPAEDIETSVFKLEQGKVFARAIRLFGSKSKFLIRTASALAGVRGTRYSIDVDSKGTTTIKCLEGELAVTGLRGKPIYIKAGQKTKVRKGDAAWTIENMSDFEISELESVETINEPTLEIIEPAGDVETGDTFIVVHGRTDKGGSVSVNGNSTGANAQGFFSESVDLKSGDNSITVSAANKQGNSTTKSITIKHTPGNETKKATAGEEPTEETADKKLVDTADSAAAATAAADEEALKGPAELSIAYPPDGFLTRKSVVTIVGKKSPGARVFVDGVAVAAKPGSKSFMKEVKLENEGKNTIKIVAQGGGVTKNATLNIIKDTTPPTLEIVKPMGQFDVTTGDCEPSVNGVTNNCYVIGFTEADAALTINKARQPIGADGSFNLTVSMAPEDTALIISAEDQAGNRVTRLITRIIEPNVVVNLSISISPSAIYSDTQSTAVITVTGKDMFGMPVDGLYVDLAMQLVFTNAGAAEILPSTLSQAAILLTNGVGTATFNAGLGPDFTSYSAVITASTGSVSDSATITLLHDGAPLPN